MKKILLGSILAAICLFAPLTSKAEEPIDVILFHGNTCPHCHELIAYLEELKEVYPQLVVHDYEVYAERENIPLFMEYADTYQIQGGAVPTSFIGEQAIIGADESKVLAAIDDCAKNGCRSALLAVDQNPNEQSDQNALLDPQGQPVGGVSQTEEDAGSDTLQKLTLPAVISGAAVDAINPCAFAVLIILITTILGSGNRRRAGLAGLAFSASVFISYYLMGLGLYSAVAAAGLSRVFYIVVSILAILIGLFNLKDWLWYGKWFIMEVPMSWRPRMQKLLRGVTSVPGAFFIGFLISVFLLPCTSGPYVVILGLLAKSATRGAALWYLALYNFIFILPMLIITAAITLGATSSEKAEAWRQSKLRFLHLIAGLIILALGLIMLGSVVLGLV